MTLEFSINPRNDWPGDVNQAFQSHEAAKHVIAGIKYLKTNGAPILGEYLKQLTTIGTEARRFKQHLHYTKKTWRQIDTIILGLDAQVKASFAQLSSALWNMTVADVPAYLQVFNGMVGNMLELVRVLQRECFHSQHLVFGYLKRSLADRAVLEVGFLRDLLERWRAASGLGPIIESILNTVLAWSEPYDAAGMTPEAAGIPQEAVDMLYVSKSLHSRISVSLPTFARPWYTDPLSPSCPSRCTFLESSNTPQVRHCDSH